MTKPRRSLFDVDAQARHDDPESSHEAARKVTASGKASDRRRMLLNSVREFPGETSAELAQRLNMDRVEVARRLPDMRDRLQLVSNGRKRRCRVTGADHSLTWLAIANATTLAAPRPSSSDTTSQLPRRRRRGTKAKTLADLPADSSPPPMPPGDAARADELVNWFRDNRDSLPSEPFELRPGERVSNPELFYAVLAGDIAAGPTAHDRAQTIPAPRWRPLLADLERLRIITNHNPDRTAGGGSQSVSSPATGENPDDKHFH